MKSGSSSAGSVITFDPDSLKERAAALEQEMGAPGFWDDQQRAASVSAEQSRLTRRLDRYERLTREYEDARDLLGMDAEMEDEIAESIVPLGKELERLQEDALFNGEYDAGDAIVTIHAGTGGTDAQDWAEMMLRMYLRWIDRRGFSSEMIEASPGEEAGIKSATMAVKGENVYGIFKAERGVHLRWIDRRGFSSEMIEASPGEEAGIKSATMAVKGENVYGIFKAERGVHRLVRLSPFDSAHRRHTSFAEVIAVS